MVIDSIIRKALIPLYFHRKQVSHKETFWIIAGTIGVYAVALISEYNFEHFYEFSRNHEE